MTRSKLLALVAAGCVGLGVLSTPSLRSYIPAISLPSTTPPPAPTPAPANLFEFDSIVDRHRQSLDPATLRALAAGVRQITTSLAYDIKSENRQLATVADVELVLSKLFSYRFGGAPSLPENFSGEIERRLAELLETAPGDDSTPITAATAPRVIEVLEALAYAYEH